MYWQPYVQKMSFFILHVSTVSPKFYLKSKILKHFAMIIFRILRRKIKAFIDILETKGLGYNDVSLIPFLKVVTVAALYLSFNTDGISNRHKNVQGLCTVALAIGFALKELRNNILVA